MIIVEDKAEWLNDAKFTGFTGLKSLALGLSVEADVKQLTTTLC